ncbi:hypothetical protein EGT81_05885 [Alcaligenes faecalis]|nr:hypothetical protein EGT81_05885 [Alcaligenes faecalis]
MAFFIACCVFVFCKEVFGIEALAFEWKLQGEIGLVFLMWGVRPWGGALARAAHGYPWLLNNPGAQ